MRARFDISAPTNLCIAAALTIGACDGAASETPRLPAGLKLPVFEAVESDTDGENLSVAVSATDAAGRSAGQAGFAGVSRDGQCRIYFNNVTSVTSDEFYDRAFDHLDGVVQAAGGVEALIAEPEKIPVAHIWGDANAPWRCVAGVIYNVQIAGYPIVGFISTPFESNAGPVVTHAAYINLPIPVPPDSRDRAAALKNKIALTARNQILWNGVPINQEMLVANLQITQRFAVVPELEFEPEAEASYEFSAKVLNIISTAHVTELRFVGNEKYCSFDTDERRGHGACIADQISAR
jgi:biopolymer transport protein ExbD